MGFLSSFRKLLPLVIGSALGLMNTCCALVNRPPPDLMLHGDTNFTPMERNCVEKSLTQWHDQTSGVVNIDVQWDLDESSTTSVWEHAIDYKVVRWLSTDLRTIAEEEYYKNLLHRQNYTLLGQTSMDLGIHNVNGMPIEVRLVADRLQDPNDCNGVALHEFGHLLGLPHNTTNKSAIMFTDFIHGRTDCLKHDDLVMFCTANKCGDAVMKPCPDDPGFGD